MKKSYFYILILVTAMVLNVLLNKPEPVEIPAAYRPLPVKKVQKQMIQQVPKFDYQKDDLPEALAPVVDSELKYRDRLLAVQSLPKKLSPVELAVLWEYLASHVSDKGNLEENAIRNDLLEHLLRQEPLPEWVGEGMIQVYNDKEQDQVWRDYIVQHMSDYIFAAWETEPTNDSQFEDIRNFYDDALKETDNSIAGTALLGMELLSHKYPFAYSANEVAEAAYQIAEAPESGDLARISAIQICAVTGYSPALETARKMVQDESLVYGCRIAAVAAIRMLGTEQDALMLEEITADAGKSPLPVAIKAACLKLRNQKS